MSKNRVFIALIASAFWFTSCDKDNQNSSRGEGTLNIELTASSETDNVTTREGGSTIGTVMDVSDFSLKVYRGEELRSSWDKFSDYKEAITYPVGSYTAVAEYGNIENEGWELPSFKGNENFDIKNDQITDVAIVCYLQNAQVGISYTDAFKDFFLSYNSKVVSSLGKTITYSADEARTAYFKPGVLTVAVDVTKQGMANSPSTITIKQFTAEARKIYNFTLDVDAGTSKLNVTFSDDVAAIETVTIDISDESLNAEAPYFIASGFENGVTQDIIEGNGLDTAQAQLFASGGIASCILSTTSKSLIEQGWPANVDLKQISANDLNVLNSLGLKLRGFGENTDGVAIVDFTNVIPFLEYNTENALNTFTLKVTDNFSRTNSEEFALKVNSINNQFAVGTINSIGLGTSTVTIPITFDGVPVEQLTVETVTFGQYRSIPFTVTETNGVSHTLQTKLPNVVSGDFSIRVSCRRKQVERIIPPLPPVFEVKAINAGDVWATKATLTIVGENETTDTYLNDKDITVQCALSGTTGWFTPTQTRKGNKIEVTGLAADLVAATSYIVKGSCVVDGVTTETANTINITTEAKTDVVNGNMDSWSGTAHSSDNWTRWWARAEKDESTSGWCTLNGLTSSENNRYAYQSNSGTEPVEGGKYTGDYVAEIKTIAWGSGTTAAAPLSIIKQNTPGELFLGIVNSDNSASYGVPFVSRPAALAFSYKCSHKGTHQITAKIVIENRTEGVVLGEALFNGDSKSDYVDKVLDITYNSNYYHLQATHLTIVFNSGTNTNSEVDVASVWASSRHTGNKLYIDNISLRY